MPANEQFWQQFWSMVDTSGGPATCWPWIGAHFHNAGYGWVPKPLAQEVGDKLAHRAAWILTNGIIPPETPHVLHHCDNPPCCNPFKCLWLGTQKDNVRDMIEKGRGGGGSPTHRDPANCACLQCRSARGELERTGVHNGRWNGLSLEDRKLIGELARDGLVTQYEIADQFGCSQQFVSKMKRTVE
jgi:hypothetical protein